MAEVKDSDTKFIDAIRDTYERERLALVVAKRKGKELTEKLAADARALTNSAIQDALANGVRPRHIHLNGLGTSSANRVYEVKAMAEVRTEFAESVTPVEVWADADADKYLLSTGVKWLHIRNAVGREVEFTFDPLRLVAQAYQAADQPIVDKNWATIFAWVVSNTEGFLEDEVVPLGDSEFRNDSPAFLTERAKRRPADDVAVVVADDDEWGEEGE